MHRYRRFLLLLVFLLLAAACSGRMPAPSNQTPVVLISIDTLRSDHLPAYGYKGVATPNIDALRADSILYQRAYSHVPLTLPSHTSILSGMLPADDGVRDNVGFRVSSKIPMIQELLKKNGYATGGAVSAFVLRKETGIAQGFDFYNDDVEPLGTDRTIGRVQRDGMKTMHVLEGWLDGQIGKPFFAFLHLYEPHTPYTPPEPFWSRYPDHYDGEIARADEIVGQFLDYLKQKGVYDKALIILLSDHGEGLNEHGEAEHGIFVYREALQVPLMVKLPREADKGATVTAPAELIDVFPTILAETATPAPATGHRIGESLLTLMQRENQREIYSESYYARFHFGWADLHSLISGNDHLIRAPQPELYDLAKDSAEKHNVLQDDRPAYFRLSQDIQPYISSQAPAPSSIDREAAAKLAALGYVGSTAAVTPGKELPDPKTTIGVFNDIRQAYTWYANGKEDQALALADKLLANNPQITDVWDLKVKILNKMGRQRDAIAAAKEGLRNVPDAVQLLYDVANDALAIGDLKTAQEHAEIAVSIEPGEAHDILARIWARRGDAAKAVAEAKLALQTDHDPTNSLIILGNADKLQGNLQGALAYYDRAVAAADKDPNRPHPGVHYARGDVLARLGRNDEAEKEFREEIHLTPDGSDAYSALIMLLATERRLDEATKVIYQMVQAVPGPHTYVVLAETLKALGDDRGAMFWTYQGLQKYPKDAELQAMPQRLRNATRLLQKGSGTK